MRSILCAAAFLLLIGSSATSAEAGAFYRFESATTGFSTQTMRGSVRVEGPQLRIDVEKGDGMLLKDGAVVVSRDGGKTLAVLDRKERSYYNLDLSQLLGGADGLLKQFGGLVKFDVQNPSVSVRKGGRGGTIAGYPTQRATVNSAYTLMLEVMKQRTPIRIEMSTQVWWTDRIAPQFASFLQMRGMRTGIEAVDRLLAAQTSAINGFPLKQVTVTRIQSGKGKPMQSETTSTVSDVRTVTVQEAEFAVPLGFKPVPSPIERMLGAF